MEKNIYAVVGGDTRQAILVNMLAAEGATVFCAGLENAPEPLTGTSVADPLTAVAMADTVILPMPPTRDGLTLNAPLSARPVSLDSAFCKALEGKRILVGIADKLRAVSLAYAALRLKDYAADEAFLLRNAQATAEGALAEILAGSPRTVCGSRILLTGCGRITRFLAPMLRALGGRVTVAARRASDRAWVRGQGMEPMNFGEIPERAKDFDVMVNTVPAPVMDAEMIRSVRSDAILLDLASLPGGIDLEACEKRGIRAWRALGLPGKYSAVTAAEIVKETVMSMTKEE